MNLNISYIYSSLSYSYKYYNYTNVFERNNSSVYIRAFLTLNMEGIFKDVALYFIYVFLI